MKQTRRDFLKLGGAALASSVLAACTGAPAATPTPAREVVVTATAAPQPLPTLPGSANTTLIFSAAPPVADPYFNALRSDLLALYQRLQSAAHPQDRFYVLADEGSVQAYGAQLPAGRVAIAGVRDVRVRDCAPVAFNDGWIGFNYDPTYMTLRNALAIQSSFDRWFNSVGVPVTRVPLVVDGGNVALYGARVVLSARLYADNARRSADEIDALLRDYLQTDAIAIIPADPADPSGQVSRLVTWLAPGVLGVAAVGDPLAGEIRRALAAALPDVALVTLPHAADNAVWNEFAGAGGVYVNTLRTPNALYVPTFDLPEDGDAVTTFEAHADLPVIPVRIGPEAQIGSGLHTLTWSAGGDFAARFLASLV